MSAIEMSASGLSDAPLLADPAALAGALGGGDPMALLMSQLGASNPQAAMMLRVLEERKLACEAERAEHDHEEAERAAAQREHDLAELRDTVERACAELDTLRTRNAELADALGACPRCFGSDALCEHCHGRGQPGGRAPDPAAFRSYVLPAVRRARAVEAQRRQSVRPDPLLQGTPQPPHNPPHYQQQYRQQPHYPSQQPAPMSQPGIQP
jgi:hypothetical protein